VGEGDCRGGSGGAGSEDGVLHGELRVGGLHYRVGLKMIYVS